MCSRYLPHVSHNISHYLNDDTINLGGLDEDPSNIKNIKNNNKEKLNLLYVKSKSRLIFAHININSIRNKFDDLKLLIHDNVDILVITETKLDDTFTSAQFYMEGFKNPISGIIIYTRENIPSKILEQLLVGANNEGIFVELNLHNSKWVLFAGYSPSKEHISPYLKKIEVIMNKFVNDYDNIIMTGDFNCDVDNKHENTDDTNMFKK